MKIAVVLSFLALCSLTAQPATVLVYNDTYGGYGDAVITAIGNVWPGATVDAYTGGEAGQIAFNASLNMRKLRRSDN
ncbi:MAG: hypothetical protein AVO35_02270 [Candidatus Aegiribacteria sp. MLS_C]|nr:MAG: hypothetical protein AVO35_02270 [Candidatus Aegiribacteria sp. MLS_C]